MSNNFKFILCLYFFSSYFCSATGLEPPEEAAFFQIIVRRDALSEPANQRPARSKNDTVFLVNIFNGRNSLGTVTSAVDPDAISISKHFIKKQKNLRKEILVSWKNSAKHLKHCVVKIIPSDFFVDSSSGASSYKLNLILTDFSSKKDATSYEDASFFLKKMISFLKSNPVLRISTGGFSDPEALENTSFCLAEGARNIMLLGPKVMQEVADIAFGSWWGFYILYQLALNPESVLKSLAFPMFPMIIDTKNGMIMVENEAKKAVLNMNANVSYPQNEPNSDLKRNQPLDTFLVLAFSVMSEKKSTPTSKPTFFPASYQAPKKISKIKKIISKKSMSSPAVSPSEETALIGELLITEGLAKQENKRAKPLFSLLHQQHQGWSGKTQEHSGGKKGADPLNTFLSLFKGLFETVWGHLVVQIG
ncbi:MAG: hypothetical protein ACRCYP_06525 [Alphaproteobacteria bacterium]